MTTTALFAVLAFLAAPLESRGSSLLRLERSGTPGGPWEQVPANELPITAEGAFEDQFDGDQAYYRMRIDKVSDGLRPRVSQERGSPQRPRKQRFSSAGIQFWRFSVSRR